MTGRQFVRTPIGQLEFNIDEVSTSRIRKYLRDMPGVLARAYEDATQRYGNNLVKKARECIDKGLPPKGASWPPLWERPSKHPSLIKSTPYDRGRDYYEAIGIYDEEVEYIGGTRVETWRYVGLPAGRKHVSNGYGGQSKHELTLIQLAKSLELGTSGPYPIPPRPLWEPLFNQVGGKAGVRTYVQNAVIRQLRSEGWNI